MSEGNWTPIERATISHSSHWITDTFVFPSKGRYGTPERTWTVTPYRHYPLKIACLPIPPLVRKFGLLWLLCITGAPDRTRTCNPMIRSHVFYPIEIQRQNILSDCATERRNLAVDEGLSPPRWDSLTHQEHWRVPASHIQVSFYVISLQGIQTLFASSVHPSLLIRSHTTLTTRHFLFRQSTILNFGCTDRIWTCITLINSQVDCQVSHGTIWNLVGLLRLERRVFWLRVRCITNFATNPWNIWSLLLPLETSKEAVWFNLRRKGHKGFFEFSISSLLYEKGTLYSARTLLSFTCFPSLRKNPFIKEISYKSLFNFQRTS